LLPISLVLVLRLRLHWRHQTATSRLSAARPPSTPAAMRLARPGSCGAWLPSGQLLGQVQRLGSAAAARQKLPSGQGSCEEVLGQKLPALRARQVQPAFVTAARHRGMAALRWKPSGTHGGSAAAGRPGFRGPLLAHLHWLPGCDDPGGQ
jgi:hypothetical protein